MSLTSLLLLSTGHPRTFHHSRVRASTPCYRRFTLPMDRSHIFGSNPDNLDALFALAFAAAPSLKLLTLLQRLTRGPIMQKVRGHPLRRSAIGLPQSVGMWFQVLFHSPTGVLFTIFARATGSLSVAEEYLALEGGPSGFKPGFTCPTLLGCPI